MSSVQGGRTMVVTLISGYSLIRHILTVDNDLQLVRFSLYSGKALPRDKKRRFGGAFQSSETRARQIAPHKIFEYFAISQVWCNNFVLNHQRKKYGIVLHIYEQYNKEK